MKVMRGSFSRLGLAAVAEGGEGLEDDALRFAVVQKFPFGEIGVGFDVDDGGFDPRGFDDLLDLLEADVG